MISPMKVFYEVLSKTGAGGFCNLLLDRKKAPGSASEARVKTCLSPAMRLTEPA